jgi:hypothetical protein
MLVQSVLALFSTLCSSDGSNRLAVTLTVCTNLLLVLGGHTDSLLLRCWSIIKHSNQSVLIAKLSSPRSFESSLLPHQTCQSKFRVPPSPDLMELVDLIDSIVFLLTSSLRQGNIHEHLFLLFKQLVRKIFSHVVGAALHRSCKAPSHLFILEKKPATQAGDCDALGPAVRLLIWHQEDTCPALSSKITAAGS